MRAVNRSKASEQQRSRADAAMVGRKLDIPGVTWSSSRVNAVLYLSTTCPYCRASMPFYRRLLSERRQPTALLAVSAQPTNNVRQYLQAQNVQFDGVYQVKLPNSLLQMTPTMMIVDDKGVILRADSGELSTAAENDMLKIIASGKL